MTDRQRIVWCEPGESRTRGIIGRIVDQTDGFLNVHLEDGRFLRLRQDFLVKVEDFPGG